MWLCLVMVAEAKLGDICFVDNSLKVSKEKLLYYENSNDKQDCDRMSASNKISIEKYISTGPSSGCIDSTGMVTHDAPASVGTRISYQAHALVIVGLFSSTTFKWQ